jgi:hypothetical protein
LLIVSVTCGSGTVNGTVASVLPSIVLFKTKLPAPTPATVHR